MGQTIKTDAIVLRSIRYGEADRILHVYTPDRGRVSAIAKGARRSKSRFGARLEPFMEVQLLLHQGRSDLSTVTGADTINARPGLWNTAPSLNGAARACDAVSRLFETDDPHPEVYTLLANELTLLSTHGTGPAAPAQRPVVIPMSPTDWPSGSSCCWSLASCPSSGRVPTAASKIISAASPLRLAAWCAPPVSRAPSDWTARPTSSWSRRSGRRWPPRRPPRHAR
jgi:hypothetical protein